MSFKVVAKAFFPVFRKSDYKCQLSVEFSAICQLSIIIIFLAIRQLPVKPIQTLC